MKAVICGLDPQGKFGIQLQDVDPREAVRMLSLAIRELAGKIGEPPGPLVTEHTAGQLDEILKQRNGVPRV